MEATRLEEVMTDCDNQYRLVEKLSGGKINTRVGINSGKNDRTRGEQKIAVKKKDIVHLSPLIQKKLELLKAKRSLKMESIQNEYEAKTWVEIYKEHPELEKFRCVVAGTDVIKICPANRDCEGCKDCG